ncbi:MAG: hypothetical protein HYX35_01880 [Proteobacteria bacterium]|nr:hypothetical protein [Pseudomonadota bacterium]
MNKKNFFIKTLAFGIVGVSLAQGGAYAQESSCSCMCSWEPAGGATGVASKQDKASNVQDCIAQCEQYYPSTNQVTYMFQCSGLVPPPPSKRK